MPQDRRHLDAISIVLQETARAWRLKLDQRLRPLGLSQAKWRTILIIARAQEPMSQKELAERLGVEGPTLVRLLDRLAADGWLERRNCPGDRRSKRVYLQDRALETLHQIEAIAANLRQEILGGIADDELRQCLSVLDKIKQRAEDLP